MGGAGNRQDLRDPGAGGRGRAAGFSRVPELRKNVTPGNSHVAEIGIIERRIRELDLDDSEYASKHSELLAERTRLKVLPAEPDREEWRETGRFVAEAWADMDSDARRAFLLSQQTRLLVGRHADGAIYGVIEYNVYGLKSLDVFGSLPGPSLLERAKARGIDKLVDAEAALND